MGQAAATISKPTVVALPDPAEVAPPSLPGFPGLPAGAAADDLLSKLAGDEVDRLLADADAPAPLPPPPPPGPRPQGEIPAEGVMPVQDVVPGDGAASAPTATAVPPADAPPPASADSAVQAQLDTLFAELTTRSPAPPAVATPAAPEIESTASSAPADPLAAGEVTDSPLPEAGEISALEAELRETLASNAAAASVVAAPTATPVADEPAEGDAPLRRRRTGPVALLLKPLEWINAPLAAARPEVRETLGKVAIVTAFNAVVVIAYVYFFRRA